MVFLEDEKGVGVRLIKKRVKSWFVDSRGEFRTMSKFNRVGLQKKKKRE